MKPPIGFVLVTYDKPEQTLALCERLNAMFAMPPIAVHHDYSQIAIEPSRFPRNVVFVEKWRRTRWGSMAVVDAQLSAIRLLYDTADPDWFVPLSTTDYPIQTADRILQDLTEGSFDAYMDFRRIHDPGLPFVNQKLGEFPFQQPRYHQFAFNRYVAIPLLSPLMARRLDIPVEKHVLGSKFLIRRLTPFHDGTECYGGDSWFTANRDVARFLLEETPQWKRLHRHFASRSVPEEGFYHTLLGNTDRFRISSENLRYTDWRDSYAHPRTLGREDFPSLLSSRKHFARKFMFDPEVLAELDAAVAEHALKHPARELTSYGSRG